jgi:hypothetical protein
MIRHDDLFLLLEVSMLRGKKQSGARYVDETDDQQNQSIPILWESDANPQSLLLFRQTHGNHRVPARQRRSLEEMPGDPGGKSQTKNRAKTSAPRVRKLPRTPSAELTTIITATTPTGF